MMFSFLGGGSFESVGLSHVKGLIAFISLVFYFVNKSNFYDYPAISIGLFKPGGRNGNLSTPENRRADISSQ